MINMICHDVIWRQNVPLVIAYIVPLLSAVGPPATEEMRIMRAEPAAFSKVQAACSREAPQTHCKRRTGINAFPSNECFEWIIATVVPAIQLLWKLLQKVLMPSSQEAL